MAEPTAFSRRELGTMMGAGLLTGCLPHKAKAATPVPSLASAAAAKGLRYGACMDLELVTKGQAFADLFKQQCGLCAPNFNWGMLEPTPGAFTASRAAKTIPFAETNHIPFSGAHLLWYHHTPAWASSLPPAQFDKALANHIVAMAQRFGPYTWSWNVVNETIKPEDGRPDGLRLEPMLNTFGPRFIDTAFHRARAADPNALLVLNDAGIEKTDAPSLARRKALINLVDGLVSRNVPIDAVGIQTHVNSSLKLDQQSYADFLQEIASRGLKILITELDVSDGGPAAMKSVHDQTSADVYRSILDVVLDQPQTAAVLTWGLFEYPFDRSNIPNIPMVSFARRVLPFTPELTPNPTFDTMMAAFRAAPARTMA